MGFRNAQCALYNCGKRLRHIIHIFGGGQLPDVIQHSRLYKLAGAFIPAPFHHLLDLQLGGGVYPKVDSFFRFLFHFIRSLS